MCQDNTEEERSNGEEEASKEEQSLGLESDEGGVPGEGYLPQTDSGEHEDEDGGEAAKQVDHHADVGYFDCEYQ